MRVCLYQADGRLPNLALMRLSAWQKAEGNKVSFFPTLDLYKRNQGQVHFASVLFDWNRRLIPDGVIAGGPGWDVAKMLPQDADICFPDYTIYPGLAEGYGYTYRGCSRRCAFCVVGKSPAWNDRRHWSIYDFMPTGWKRLNLLNNNTLQDERWRETFEEIITGDITLFDHNGYDARMITREMAAVMNRVQWGGRINFAWDRMRDEEEILRGARVILSEIPARRVNWYVLVGCDTTIEEDLYRINALRDLGFDCYAMRFTRSPELNRLAVWCNTAKLYHACRYEDYEDSKAVGLGDHGRKKQRKTTSYYVAGSKLKGYKVRGGHKKLAVKLPVGVRRGEGGRWVRVASRGKWEGGGAPPS